MTLSQGRPYLAIPGPSVIPDPVLQAMHRPAPNIYEGALPDMVPGLITDLCRVAQTNGHAAIYIGNGHAMWEAALANTVAAGEKVLVLATGRFGHGWADVAEARGITTEILDHETFHTIDPDRLRAALRADAGQKIRAVLAVHTDTSTSVRSDIAVLRQVLDEEGHPALLMVDCIASLGCDEFRMDDWGVDVMITGSQKGLMVPPGLGFVYFNATARAQRTGLSQVSRYWDWDRRVEPEIFYHYFNGTAPTHHLHGLRVALDMIHDEGMEAVWARHATLAQALWAAVSHWGSAGPMHMCVADPSLRSHAVSTLKIGAPHGTALRRWCETQAGVTLGIPLGMSETDDPNGDGFFRFGHMGHVNAHMILGLLGTVEAGLGALDIPHAPGGVAAASQVIAQATRNT
jgi:alanine-glyoxylate transaminase/serine-glyoxylate transaminase/serine-pyruvate transaminase